MQVLCHFLVVAVCSLALVHGTPGSPTTLLPKTTAPPSAPTTQVIQTYNTSRVEINPDPATVASNCTANFTAALTSMISYWFVDAVASNKGSYPPISNPDGLFTAYVIKGEEVSGRRLIGKAKENGPSLRSGQRDRRLCVQSSACLHCCLPYCGSFCWVGGQCRLCGDRNLRNLRDNTWWWGGNETQNDVAESMQFAARRWLNSNDPGRCMGDPWKFAVKVNYF